MRLKQRVRQNLARRYTISPRVGNAEFPRMAFGAVAREIRVRLGLYDPLTRLADRYKSDKGVTLWPFHGYSIQYAKLFERFKDRPINLLEIGLLRRMDRDTLGVTCPSLSMWLDYFPKAQIYGFDIDDFSQVKLPRTHIFRGDQGKAEDLMKLVAQCPRFDIIIDDGSHASYHQQLTLKILFPHLASNGLYVIEDLHWQNAELEASLPTVPKTKDFLKDSTALNQTISGAKEVLLFESPFKKGMEKLAVITKA
jgi:hypothetical protein